MSKSLWLILAILCDLLAGFIVFLNVTRDDPVMRGWVIAAVLLAAGGACTFKFIKAPKAVKKEEPEPTPEPAAEG